MNILEKRKQKHLSNSHMVNYITISVVQAN